MSTTEWTAIVQAANELAERQSGDIADVSLDDIAAQVGISRATLYRRIGNRQRLDEAIRAAGLDPGGRGDVRERAINAAAEIISEGGFSAFTLEAVAARASCSIPALHAQLGGRDALLAATFERFSPLPRIEEALEQRPESLEEGVRRIYTIAFDTATARPRLIAAVIFRCPCPLGRPDGQVSAFELRAPSPRGRRGMVGGAKGRRSRAPTAGADAAPTAGRADCIACSNARTGCQHRHRTAAFA